jgi:hypothetical protein
MCNEHVGHAPDAWIARQEERKRHDGKLRHAVQDDLHEPRLGTLLRIAHAEDGRGLQQFVGQPVDGDHAALGRHECHGRHGGGARHTRRFAFGVEGVERQRRGGREPVQHARRHPDRVPGRRHPAR